MTTTDDAPSGWPRRHFQPGGGDAQVFYKIHGAFREPPKVSRAKHRCAGIPAGIDLRQHTRETAAELLEMGLGDDWISRELRRTNPSLHAAASSSNECLVLAGQVSDPESLDYFRDVIGLVTALFESGGVAVFDPHMFKWWSPEEWRERVFEPAGAVPRHHVMILVSEEEQAGKLWYHTRGMAKFGRPDLSIHDVSTELAPVIEDLCNRFIEMMAFGAVIPEGQAIKMASLPPGWRCRHAGSMDDPDFNNVHVEIGPQRSEDRGSSRGEASRREGPA